jgi:hypothetical protein
VTFTVGEKTTASELTALINPTRLGCTLTMSGQTLTSGVQGVLSWTTAAENVSPGFITVPSTTVTIPAGSAGVYAVTTRILMSGTPTTARSYLDINFVSTLTADTDVYRLGSLDSNEAGRMVMSATVPLAVADTFTVNVMQNSGGNLTVSAALFCYRVGA